MTLTEFLYARIAEDEKIARDDHEELSGGTSGYFWGGNDWGSWIGIDRARVLAECQAKRRIIKAVRETYEDADEYSGWRELAGDVLRGLASVYADHPDYRQEWA